LTPCSLPSDQFLPKSKIRLFVVAAPPYRLAKDLAVPAPRVGDIVRGKRAISADTALRLGIYFGLPAQFWLNLQNEYDLRRAGASPALKRIARRAA